MFKKGDYVAIHKSPVWRIRADCVFRLPIKNEGDKGEWEQLWWRTVARHRFVLCCIPFFVQNIALGDEIETEIDSGNVRVVTFSGQTTFRIWFGDQTEVVRKKIASTIEEMNVLMEWSSENLLAVSVGKMDAQEFADFLHLHEQQGFLHYETGSAV